MALPPPSPEGTCLVTGASAGLGREIARALARRGRGVTLVARDEVRLRELAAELAAAHGIRAEVAPCDLTDPVARAATLADVAARGLRVDVLVNDAGLTTNARVAQADVDRELALVRVNVEALVDLTTRCVPGMVARRSGAVLNLASIAAFAPVPNQAAYAASKAFVLSYTDALGAELAGTGVAVSALCPGPTATEIFDRAGGTNPVDRMPGPFWRSAEEVAEGGVHALERGRARAFVGPVNRAAAAVAQHLPRARPVLALGARLFTAPGRPNPARRWTGE